MEENGLSADMDAALYFIAATFGPWQKTSSFEARRVNNVLTLYN